MSNATPPQIRFAEDAWDSFETAVTRLAGWTVEIGGRRYVLDGVVNDDGTVNGKAENGFGDVYGETIKIVVGNSITVL